MSKLQKWFKLDNAAKIFPATANNERSNVFRLAFYLDHQINADKLQQATNIVLKRLTLFNTEIRSGFFWNFLSENKNIFKVEKEPSIVCKHYSFKDNNYFLFRLYYFNNKISLETFHALTDGKGALEFFKSIIYEYLILMGNKINDEGMIVSRQPFDPKENEDSFSLNYNNKYKHRLKEHKAYQIKGRKFKRNFQLVFTINTNKNEIISLVRNKYKSTITEYLTSILAYAIYIEAKNTKKNNKPISMFIPVNLRPYFDSKSLKNFAIYIKTNYNLKENLNFNDFISITKKDFNSQLTKENLEKRMNKQVAIEKNSFIRATPLALKNLFLKAGYKLQGVNKITSSFSNLGEVHLPKDMQKHIKNIDFINTGFNLTATLITYKDNVNFTISQPLKDINIIRRIVSLLNKDNLELKVTTNYKEAYNEIL